jgi:hypothetical protein
MNMLFHYQVVTLAVYTYFVTSIIGHQWVEGMDADPQNQRYLIDMYFPIFTMLQVSIFTTLQVIIFTTLQVSIFLNTQEEKLYS